MRYPILHRMVNKYRRPWPMHLRYSKYIDINYRFSKAQIVDLKRLVSPSADKWADDMLKRRKPIRHE